MSFLSLILSLREVESEVQCVFLVWQEKGSDMGFFRVLLLFHPGKMKKPSGITPRTSWSEYKDPQGSHVLTCLT